MPSRIDLHHPELQRLLRLQSGVLTRAQALSVGATKGDLDRMLRRNEIRRVHPGLFVDHTGPLTYEQREWVAVLAAWPAALCGPPAIPGRRPAVIEVAVERGRTVVAPKGVRVRRTTRLADRLRRGTQPPRVRLEEAVVELLSVRLLDGDVAGAFGELTQACYRRPALPEAILDAVRARPRLAKRRLLEELVADLRDGACSVLERGYLHHVERAHGLPCGSRQVVSEASGHRTAIDVRYDDFGVVVELQGRAFHDTAAAYDADADRDLAEAAAAAAHTLRVTYGQVFRTPCQSAAWIATVLHRGGWDGRLGRCKSCPTVVGEVAQFD